jgi:uncharacterized protein with gpF-like domain
MMTPLRAPGKKDVILPPISPNSQSEQSYRAAIQKAVANMRASYEWWIASKYRKALEANVDTGRLPELAQDAAKGDGVKARTDALFFELTRLRTYWTDYFDTFAKKLAEQQAQTWYRDNATAWGGRLKRAGFDVPMQLTPSQKLILRAKVPENVALIKSIQQDYHKDIEGIVLRSFVAGRDLATMAEEIKKKGDVSTRRAAFIAEDQSNKATAQMNAARQRELGITRAIWIHSSAGKEPRPKHVQAGRERWEFDPSVGIDFGDGFGFVKPGEAIKCRCISRSVIPAIGRGADFEHSMTVEKSRLGAKGVLKDRPAQGGPKKSPWAQDAYRG